MNTASPRPPKQLVLDVLPAPEPSFDNYVVGPNTVIVETLRDLPVGRTVYLWGQPGSGRSHLLRAMSIGPDRHYINAETSLEALQEIADVDSSKPLPLLLAVDDLHLMNEAKLGALFGIYNRWRESSASTHAMSLVVAANQPPHLMPIREDLRTRLGWDLVFRLDALTDADKMDALARQAAERSLPLGPDILNWILIHYDRDMRRLVSLLDALDRYSLAEKRPITLPLLREMLAERTQQADPYLE